MHEEVHGLAIVGRFGSEGLPVVLEVPERREVGELAVVAVVVVVVVGVVVGVVVVVGGRAVVDSTSTWPVSAENLKRTFSDP